MKFKLPITGMTTGSELALTVTYQYMYLNFNARILS